MKRLLLNLALFSLISTHLFAAPEPEGTPGLSFPGETLSEWRGFKQHKFEIDGCTAWVVEPKVALPGKPWSWCMEFPKAFTDRTAAPELVAAGFHHVYIKVGNTFGSPAALKHCDAFYQLLVEKGLSKKAVLIGISRGGLYAYRFAMENPDRVSVIYGDAAVCDFKSWPGGKGKAKRSDGDWAALMSSYGFKDEAEALAYPNNPIDRLEPLAKAKVAIIHVVGDADKTVVPEENSILLGERYKALGGTFEIIHKPGVDHHPHGLEDSSPVVKFILKHGTPQ